MKSVHPQGEDRPDVSFPPVTAIHPLHEDLLLQEQMRRLHNSRARQRAARHHRAGRSLI
ncbi:hypothetical protein MKK88_19255 [Methylobacterium sp. E-005]|uniref:hypothetical protein n=1 Tax=Methylobacterium sp. E-005 TaxID=2836549 RepID=UPI001FB9811C|nr:hypothetical protein [Methylobacterium sp. E-005]MCJ2088103.1 hypothetical protein [Methylobacterium sp. E-005]